MDLYMEPFLISQLGTLTHFGRLDAEVLNNSLCKTLIKAAFDFVHPEAEGRALAPPQRHHQRQHELHGPHDGDDVDATGARRPPSHALAPAPAPASPSARVPAPRPPPPQPGARAGRAPPPAGTQPPSQLPQPPPPRRAPAPDLSAPADALLHTREWRGFRAELRLLGNPKTQIALIGEAAISG